MDKSKKEKCVIIGPSGSGKDFLLRKLVEKGLKACLKMTTRPKRKHEVEMVSYNFVDTKIFLDKIQNKEFLCYDTFVVTPEDKSPQTWYYGITFEEFENSQVVIMTPSEFSKIIPEQRKSCFVVYLDIDRDVRESRISRRKDKNDSVKRRLDADELDFLNFKDYDLRIKDPDFGADDVYELMD